MFRIPPASPGRVAPLLAVVAALAACSGGAMSQKQAQAATVAQVDGGALTGAALQRWLLKDDSFPGRAVANTLVSSWINTALLIDNLRRNRTLDDSATIDAVITPDAERGVSRQYFLARDGARPPITNDQADSVANRDHVRVFQQIVIRLPPNLDSQTAVGIRARVQSLTQRARNGADFSALVKEASEDSATRANNGFMPAITQQQLQMLPPRMRAIWNLRPGEISDPTVSGAGVHILRRATADQARPYLKAWLVPIRARRLDSLFVDSLVKAHHVVVAADARPRLRALAREPVTVRDSEPFATWDNGKLTPALVRSATLMLDARTRTGLSNGSDSLVEVYLNSLAQQRVLLGVIVHGPMPTAEARKAMTPMYLNVMGILKDQLTQLPKSLSPADAATMYIDSVIAGKRRYVPLPGTLSEVLRTGANITVDTAAVAGVYQAAVPEWEAAHANDTTRMSRPVAPAPVPNPPAAAKPPH